MSSNLSGDELDVFETVGDLIFNYIHGRDMIGIDLGDNVLTLFFYGDYRVKIEGFSDCCSYSYVDDVVFNDIGNNVVVDYAAISSGDSNDYVFFNDEDEEVLRVSVTLCEGSGYYDFGFDVVSYTEQHDNDNVVQ